MSREPSELNNSILVDLELEVVSDGCPEFHERRRELRKSCGDTHTNLEHSEPLGVSQGGCITFPRVVGETLPTELQTGHGIHASRMRSLLDV